MDRRKFIRGSGLFGGMIAGVIAGKTVVEKIHTREVITNVGTASASDAPSTLKMPITLFTDNPDLNTKKQKDTTLSQDGNLYTFSSCGIDASEYEVVVKNNVSMAAGKDNRLWIKVNDEWFRLAVDKTIT